MEKSTGSGGAAADKASDGPYKTVEKTPVAVESQNARESSEDSVVFVSETRILARGGRRPLKVITDEEVASAKAEEEWKPKSARMSLGPREELRAKRRRDWEEVRARNTKANRK